MVNILKKLDEKEEMPYLDFVKKCTAKGYTPSDVDLEEFETL